MIILFEYEEKNLILLEGHVRLTAYMLEPDAVSKGVEAIVGYTSFGGGQRKRKNNIKIYELY
ncbi:MAG: hypothetical protein GX175_02010 [Halanaerobiaceae bacterium]|jgi:hypothetical protein|nr:hypothetical protein [Halanaerobiaceae bacterium]